MTDSCLPGGNVTEGLSSSALDGPVVILFLDVIELYISIVIDGNYPAAIGRYVHARL